MNSGRVHFLSLPNLATDQVEAIDAPWDIEVPEDVKALSTTDYKRRWRDPTVHHWLLLLVEGRDPTRAVSVANPAAVLYGFAADYDSPIGARPSARGRRAGTPRRGGASPTVASSTSTGSSTAR